MRISCNMAACRSDQLHNYRGFAEQSNRCLITSSSACGTSGIALFLLVGGNNLIHSTVLVFSAYLA